jgi:hypothetical protein
VSEPPHVHIGKDGKETKFWLNPVAVAHSGHFSKHELNQIEKIVIRFRKHILEIWQQEQEQHENC